METRYRIVIYCPDRHILYDATTPDRKGVGGGVTARIRLAQALSRLGHKVTIIAHVTRKQIHMGVQYLPLSESGTPLEADVLLMISSGGALTLLPAKELHVQARLREVWAVGTIPIAGLNEIKPDYIIAVSNFVRDVIYEEWKVPFGKVLTIYNGATLPQSSFPFFNKRQCDPFSLIYANHPSKGLGAAIAVLRLLRQQDLRFVLHVYGSDALWGGAETSPSPEPGVIYHGTVGQAQLNRGFLQANISLHLQARLEPFAIALVNAMGCGCIPIASSVGGNKEAIQDGYNGFLIAGDHESQDVHQRTAELILRLIHSPNFAAYIHRNAMSVPWTWDLQAQVWLQHWQWVLENKGESIQNDSCFCPACKGKWLLAADGYHCLNCGYYSRDGKR